MSKTCGSCTVCCVAPRVEEFSKPCGTQCPKLNPELLEGACTIYNSRPYRCRQFECWWLVSNEMMAPPEFRPDRCGIMIYVYGDLIYVWEQSSTWEGSELESWILPRAAGRKVVVVHRHQPLVFLKQY